MIGPLAIICAIAELVSVAAYKDICNTVSLGFKENIFSHPPSRMPANSRYIIHVWHASFRAISLAKSIDAGVSPIDMAALNFVCYIWFLDRVLSSSTKKRWSGTGCAPDTQFVFHNVA